MAPEMKRADTTGEKVQFFFDTSAVVVVEARRQDSKLVYNGRICVNYVGRKENN